MSDFTTLATNLFTPKDGPPRKILPTERRVRGRLNGRFIFDTTAAKMVWETYAPLYWIPKADFVASAPLTAKETVSVADVDSDISTLTVDGKSIQALVVSGSAKSELAGYVKVNFKDLDAWYEEQTQGFYSPKDPFHRVDIFPSGRHVRVEIDGTCLADTGEEGGVHALFETNLPGRWYLPRTAIQWQYLVPSDTHTACPYKGEASYYSALINGKEYKDAAWWYPHPTQESATIVGMLCFYPAKVDTWLDGKKM